MLWALCAWRLRYQPEHPGLAVVILGDAPEDARSRGFIRVKPADARRGLDGARSLSLTGVQLMARYWRKLCGRSPVLSMERGRAAKAPKDLIEMGAHQAVFFPRMDGSALTLSRFDELLFSCLDKDWSTPVDVFVHPSPAGEELRNGLGRRIGDIPLAMRLRQWAEHRGAEAALESVPYKPDRAPMLEARYRLTAVGHAIRRHGLTEIGQGPPWPMWGATAYDPAAPWVVAHDLAALSAPPALYLLK